MTNPKNESQETSNVAQDELDINWEEALAEQRAAESAAAADSLSASQAQGLGSLDDEWAKALEEQAQGGATSTPAATEPTTTASSPKTSSEEATTAKQHTATSAQNIFQPLDHQSGGAKSDIDMIMDIPVQLSVELGRTRLTIKNILQLGQGSVVELDGLAGEPMDIYVNGYLIAQGEVVVVDDKYGVRITDIITPSDRIHRLNTRR